MKKKLLIALIVILVVFGGIQLVPVQRDNPPVSQDIGAPPAVAMVLERSCYDCHSHETVWPWYSQVAPVSFLVSNHVEDGRKHLNFSTWNAYDGEQRRHLLEEALSEIASGHMPIDQYLWMHSEARLTESDRELLRQWVESLQQDNGFGFDDFGGGRPERADQPEPADTAEDHDHDH